VWHPSDTICAERCHSIYEHCQCLILFPVLPRAVFHGFFFLLPLSRKLAPAQHKWCSRRFSMCCFTSFFRHSCSVRWQRKNLIIDGKIVYSPAPVFLQNTLARSSLAISREISLRCLAVGMFYLFILGMVDNIRQQVLNLLPHVRASSVDDYQR
jgi:hypothetical protein